MEADISTWQKTGHFYFALTVGAGGREGLFKAIGAGGEELEEVQVPEDLELLADFIAHVCVVGVQTGSPW
jgi:hypothetical protein